LSVLNLSRDKVEKQSRIKAKNATKTNLILIKFKDRSHGQCALKEATKLRGKIEFEGIYLNKDKTKNERVVERERAKKRLEQKKCTSRRQERRGQADRNLPREEILMGNPIRRAKKNFRLVSILISFVNMFLCFFLEKARYYRWGTAFRLIPAGKLLVVML
jgi:hypothetical protein